MTLGSGWAAEAAPFSLVTEDDDLVSASPAPAADRARSSARSLQRPMLVRKNADNTIRWSAGERLDHLFEQRCDQFTGSGKDQAVVTDDLALTFRELDNRANQVARYLLDQGITSGDRVGLLFDRTIDSYVALLAVLKVNAAYVPLDAGFPTERIASSSVTPASSRWCRCRRSEASSTSSRSARSCSTPPSARSPRSPTTRLSDAEKAPPVDQLAYLIYTSGTTGNPKGVAIEHAEHLQLRPGRRRALRLSGAGDRVYQGMTIAFDFSVEELWVPLIAGATLVPASPAPAWWATTSRTSCASAGSPACAACPTLLATIEKDLPDLRILLVSGEACPQNLVGPLASPRPHHPQRLRPDRGHRHRDPDRAAPGQAGDHRRAAADLLDRDPRPAQGRSALRPGEMGEIGIAGIGLAAGYLNRDDLTAEEVHPPTSSKSPTTRPGASTAPATSAASPRPARSSSTAASTPRSRSAATGSS